ncbi:MAG TPA: serine hydrolase, partial [Rhodothermales bacterium]|nr:serine hydrolase [Rhodothermales bacterium]
DQWMAANVFEPLGMTHTRVRMRQGQIIPGVADGHGFGESAGYERVQDIASFAGASSVTTTARDLARWLINMRDGRVGGLEVQQMLRTRSVTTGGDTLNYGLGLIVDTWRGTRRIAHDGAENGTSAFVGYYPDLDAAVVVLSNEAGYPATSRAGQILEAYFPDRLTPAGAPAPPRTAGAAPFVPARFDAYAGEFELAPGFVLNFTRTGSRYYVQATGQPRFELFPSSDSTFFLTVVQASATFHREPGGRVERLTWHQGGDAPGRRVAPYRPDSTALSAYVGRYYSEELDATYTVELRDGALFVSSRRLGAPIRLAPSKPDLFTGTGVLPEARFERGADGSVTVLLASYFRTRGVRFERVRGGELGGRK